MRAQEGLSAGWVGPMKRLVIPALLAIPLGAHAQQVDTAVAIGYIDPGEYGVTVTAECDSDFVVVGGGFGRTNVNLEVLHSKPAITPRHGWQVEFWNKHPLQQWGYAYALCLRSSAPLAGQSAPAAPTPAPPNPSVEAPAAATSAGQWISAGTSRDLDERMEARSWLLDSSGVVGMAIASPCPPRPECSPADDVLITWYDDGTLSETPFRAEDGTPLDPVGERLRSPYALPSGQRPVDIVGIGIAEGERVTAWYRDGTRSTGSIRDLGSGSAGEPYALPPGKSPADIVGLDKAPSNGWAYAWYADGTVSAGTDEDLDAQRAPYPYALPPGVRAADVLDIAIGHGDWVFAWCAAAQAAPATPPEAISAVAAPVADMAAIARAVPSYTYSRGTSTDLGRAEESSEGGLGVVGLAFGKGSLAVPFYTWHADGTVRSVSHEDLSWASRPDHHRRYSLPPGKQPADIIDIGIASDNVVYVWYRDGTVSKGTTTDLGAYGNYPFTLPLNKTPADIVGMEIAESNDWVYAWYRQGTVSTGSSSDLDLYRPPQAFKLPPGRTPEQVIGMGIDPLDRVYAWYQEPAEATPR